MEILKRNIVPTLVLSALALIITAMTWFAAKDVKNSFMVAAGIVGLGVCVLCMTNYRVGYYLVISICMCVRTFERLAVTEMPVGAIQDLLLACTLVGAIFSRSRTKVIKVDAFRDPLLLIFYFYGCYMLLQFLNPNAVSTAGAQLFIRVFIRNMILLFLTMRMINSMADLRNFLNIGSCCVHWPLSMPVYRIGSGSCRLNRIMWRCTPINSGRLFCLPGLGYSLLCQTLRY